MSLWKKALTALTFRNELLCSSQIADNHFHEILISARRIIETKFNQFD